MIDVDNVTKYYGPVLAVDRVSFQVPEGEIVGFLGPNGAGKTTTLRILTSYLPATSGIARVAGHDVMTESMAVRRSIGYLPESVPLYPEMRVDEYLTYRAKLKGIERIKRPARVDYCLERCRIREVRRRRIGTLSKGYRQRVGLADAMVHDPPILILDEPTVGLDPVQIHETLGLIRELGQKRTILLSTHILAEVEMVCRRVIIISAGKVSADKMLRDLEGSRGITMEAHGPVEAMTAAVQQIDGVADVATRELNGDLVSFVIRTRDNADCREAISRCCAEHGWPIRQLGLRHRRLEELFFEVVRQSQGSGARGQGPGVRGQESGDGGQESGDGSEKSRDQQTPSPDSSS